MPRVDDGLEAEDTSIAEVPVIGPVARTGPIGVFGRFQTFFAVGVEGPL
jgi:hypothetical protein